MARTTKQLSGGGKDKFFRGLVASVPGVTAETAKAVSDELNEHVTEVRVRRETWERLSDVAPEVAPRAPQAKATPKPVVAAPPATALAAAPVAPEFDPFAFSAIALLTRKGKAALLAELEKIESVENLRRLADAQHLALDPALSDAAAIRSALVAGAERRIAERKAAAS